MKLNKRIAAAVLSGCLTVGAVQGAMPLTSFAAITDYDSNDVVWYYDDSLFRGYGESAPNEKFIKAIQSATNVKDYTEITFGNLERITSLNLSGMGLESIPGIVQYMPRLRTLDLSNNKLRSSTIGTLDLSKDIALTSVDLSNNYLTSVPAWFSALNITTKKINNNLLNSTNQRKLVVTPDTYYFGVGDTLSDLDITAIKDKVLSTVTLSDKSLLPEYFYDPALPTYTIPDSEKNNSAYLKNENIEFDIDFSSNVTNGVVSKAGKITGTISLGIYGTGTSSNPNIRTTVTVYFLDGSDPTTVKFRLETLISECEKLTKDSYTSTSWTVFSNQLSTAKAILSYSNTDSDMLQNAYDSLTEAKKNLVSGVNANTKKILSDLLTIAKTYKDIAKKYNFQGFRRGHAPRPVIDGIIGWFDSHRCGLQWIVLVLALTICAYTGFLISALIRFPLINQAVLPALFVASGLSAGAAASKMVAAGMFGEDQHSADLKLLHGAEWPIMAAEALCIFMIAVALIGGNAAAQVAAQAFTTGAWATEFWIGVVGIGFIVPILLSGVKNSAGFYLSGLASVTGMMCLRLFILYAGQLYSI